MPDLSALHIARGEVIEAIAEATAHHFTDAARPLRERIEALCPLDLLVERVVLAAPVKADGARFRLAEGGAPHVIVALRNPFGELEDLAAFAPDPPHAARRLTNRVPALGLDAWTDARLHPAFRLSVHADIWSWLAAHGQGLLPIDWRSCALEFLARGVAGLIAADLAQGRTIERRLARALKPPPIVIPEKKEAA